MTAAECIITRRSIRKYTEVMPDMDLVKDIISIASYAPSWKNSQTTSYIVIIDSKTKQAIADSMDFKPNVATTSSAPMLVVMTTKVGVSGFNRDGSFSSSRRDGWQMFDAGIACQTFCLAAHSRGLSTVIMGIYNDEATRKILNVPDDRIITALVALGFADQMPAAPPRKSVDELLTVI